MVINPTISKILRILEKYLIQKTDFRLGHNYDLILIVPSDSDYLEKYSWIVSSRHLDQVPQNTFINDIINDFKEVLTFEEYSSVSRINKLDSNHPFVKNVKFMFSINKETVEINNLRIGGSHIDRGMIIHSRILEKIIANQAVTFVLENGKLSNAGIISMDNNFRIKHYTGKGLQELFKPDRTEEEIQRGNDILNRDDEFLINNQYLAYTHLNDIDTVYIQK